MGDASQMILRQKVHPNIRYRRDEHAREISRKNKKGEFDDHSDLARAARRRNGRAEASNRLSADSRRSRYFCGGKSAQRSAGARAAQSAARDKSLSPADVCRSPPAGDARTRRTLTTLAQFQQRDEPRGEERANIRGGDIGQTIDLSASRAYDSALEILGAYKLTGNFHLNLEIVLKDIDAFDRVTFEIEPRSSCPTPRIADMSCFDPTQTFTWTNSAKSFAP